MTTETEINEFLVEFSDADLHNLDGSSLGVVAEAVPPETVRSNFGAAAYRKTGKMFLLAVIAQILVLAGFAAAPAFTLATGKVVVLKTLPVDPYDLFRGEYLALRYDISQLHCDEKLPRGRQVFVILKAGQPYWKATKIVSSKPSALPPDEVAMSARVEYEDYQGTTDLHYGIEQYYRPEGTGKDLQSLHPDAKIAVDCFGNSVIKELKSEKKI